VVRHSRDKKIKGCFERVRLCTLRGARRVWQLSQYVHIEIKGLCLILNSGNSLTWTVLDLVEEDGWQLGIQIKRTRKRKGKRARTLFWESHRSLHDGQRWVTGRQSRNRIKNFLHFNLLGISKIKKTAIRKLK
jgi:hypothetical protein